MSTKYSMEPTIKFCLFFYKNVVLSFFINLQLFAENKYTRHSTVRIQAVDPTDLGCARTCSNWPERFGTKLPQRSPQCSGPLGSLSVRFSPRSLRHKRHTVESQCVFVL